MGLTAQFLSHTFQILEINLSFEGVKIILIYIIKISLKQFLMLKKRNQVLSPSIETSMSKHKINILFVSLPPTHSEV